MNSDDAVRAAKQQLRVDLLHRRRKRQLDPDTANALAAVAAAEPLLARARRVAAYLAMPTEPPTSALISSLIDRGCEVIVPIVAADHQLAWASVDDSVQVATSSMGIPEPTTSGTFSEMGPCDVMLVPALAADHAGHRLGRGAGYYDRALAAVTAPIVAVVFTDELLPEIPHEPHDVRVDAVLTPSGMFRVPQTL